MTKSDITTPISNYFSAFALSGKEKKNFSWKQGVELSYIWVIENLEIPQHHLMTTKELHKTKLGKQNYCIGLMDRNWVWEQNNWRVFVSKRGASFELKEGLTMSQVCEAWQDYFFKMTGKQSKLVWK